jgi:hypothetical protein
MSGVEDAGFLDPEAARAVAKRWVELRESQRASVVDRKVEALLKIIDHRIEADRNKRATLFDRAISLLRRLLNRLAGNGLARRDDVRKQQVLHSGDLVLQLGEIIFGHGVLSDGGDDAETTPRADTPESKKGGGK